MATVKKSLVCVRGVFPMTKKHIDRLLRQNVIVAHPDGDYRIHHKLPLIIATAILEEMNIIPASR